MHEFIGSQETFDHIKSFSSSNKTINQKEIIQKLLEQQALQGRENAVRAEQHKTIKIFKSIDNFAIGTFKHEEKKKFVPLFPHIYFSTPD